MDTTATAQFQVGDLVRFLNADRWCGRVERIGLGERGDYIHVRTFTPCVFGDDYNLVWSVDRFEYAKPRPNKARKELAATKARLAKLQAVADAARKLMKYTEDFGELGVAVRTRPNEMTTLTPEGMAAARTLAAAIKALDGD